MSEKSAHTVFGFDGREEPAIVDHGDGFVTIRLGNAWCSARPDAATAIAMSLLQHAAAARAESEGKQQP